MAQRKIGRNEPCWCGSGKKYKKCHADRSLQERIPYHKLATETRQLLHGDRSCLHPSAAGRCSNPVISAHSISKSTALSRIERDGHVYQPNADPFEIQKQRGRIRHKLVGIRNATTFTGFCSEHDALLFKPIDVGTLVPTLEQCFLLHYRAVCRELYVKKPTLLTNELWREADRGRPLDVQRFVQDVVIGRNEAIQASIRDLMAAKAVCDKAILEEDFANLSGCVLSFGEVPTLACSGLTHPIYDFSGTIIQDISDCSKPAWDLSFTLLPTDAGGLAMFCWLRDADTICRAFVSSLLKLPDDRKTDAIVQLIFDAFENHVAAPDWWEDISDDLKTSLEMRILNWTDMNLIDSTALKPGVEKYANWKFQSATWI